MTSIELPGKRMPNFEDSLLLPLKLETDFCRSSWIYARKTYANFKIHTMSIIEGVWKILTLYIFEIFSTWVANLDFLTVLDIFFYIDPRQQVNKFGVIYNETSQQVNMFSIFWHKSTSQYILILTQVNVSINISLVVRVYQLCTRII